MDQTSRPREGGPNEDATVCGEARVVLACESLLITPALVALVHQGAPPSAIRAAAREEGMWTLRESALRSALLGLTTIAEAVRVTTESTRRGP